MTIRKRFILAYLIIGSILIVATILSLFVRLQFASINAKVLHDSRNGAVLGQLSLLTQQLLMPPNDFLISLDQKELKKYDSTHDSLSALVDGTLPGVLDQEMIGNVRFLIGSIDTDARKIMGKKRKDEESIALMYHMDSLGRELSGVLMQEVSKNNQHLDELVSKNRQIVAMVNLLSIVVVLGVVAGALLTIAFLEKNLHDPIQRLIKGFRGVSHGRWNQVKIRGDTELTALAHEFNTMVEQLGATYDVLEKEVRNRTNELGELNKKLASEALRDGLSGLYNHRYCYEKLYQEFERAKRYRHPLAVFMIDIDYFKQYNDNNGHLEGDKVIKGVAEILSKASRKTDTVARYGGEEFVIIAPEFDADSALALGERLRSAVAEHQFSNEKKQPGGDLTISVGIALYPEKNCDAVGLLQCADEALYEAKNSGRNRVVFSDPQKAGSEHRKQKR